MQTLETLDKKIKTATDLLSVVKTMKTLAAVNIRQYERAVLALESYRQVVDKGWQALFRYNGIEGPRFKHRYAVVILIGTDQGMCGRFNELIMATALTESVKMRQQGIDVDVWTVGEKVETGIQESGFNGAIRYQVPASLHTINVMVGDMTEKIENWGRTRGEAYFYLCHNLLAKKSGYKQVFYPVLPLDKKWAQDRKDIPWPGKCLPLLGLPNADMFRQLFRQYLYISISRALVQSLAGENQARLAAMQAAEKNIEELELDLKKLYREQRQMNITNELLDIIAGFEAIGGEKEI